MPRPFPSDISTGGVLISDGGPGTTKPGVPGPAAPLFTASLDLTGSLTSQQVKGFRTRPLSADVPIVGDSYIYDGILFNPGEIPGGNLQRLSRTLWVDGGTVFPSEQWTGSVARPFGTLKAAMDLIASSGPLEKDWHVLVGPWIFFLDVEDFVYVPSGKNVIIEGATQDTTAVLFASYTDDTPVLFISQLVSDPAATVTLRNIRTAVYFERFGSTELGIRLEDCFLTMLDGAAEVGDVTRLEMFDSTVTFQSFVPFGPVTMDGCTVTGDISGTSFDIEDSASTSSPLELSVIDTGSLVRARGMRSAVEVSFNTPGGVLEVDGLTAANGAACDESGHVRLIDMPDLSAVVTTLNATPVPVTLNVPYDPSSSETIELWATGRDTVNGDTAGFYISGVFKHTGTVTQVGVTSVFHSVKDDAAWAIAFAVVSGTTIVLNVTGDATNPVEWSVRWRILGEPLDLT